MSVKRKWICTPAMFLEMVIEKRWNVRLARSELVSAPNT